MISISVLVSEIKKGRAYLLSVIDRSITVVFSVVYIAKKVFVRKKIKSDVKEFTMLLLFVDDCCSSKGEFCRRKENEVSVEVMRDTLESAKK